MYKIKKMVAEMAGVSVNVVKIVVSPYRICPLGAHIDHQVDTYIFPFTNRFVSCLFTASLHFYFFCYELKGWSRVCHDD